MAQEKPAWVNAALAKWLAQKLPELWVSARAGRASDRGGQLALRFVWRAIAGRNAMNEGILIRNGNIITVDPYI